MQPPIDKDNKIPITFRLLANMNFRTTTFAILTFRIAYIFLLFTKEEFSKSNLLGRGKKHYKIDEYLGDFIAISISNKAIRYTIDGNKFKKLIADHAGMTKEEMEVPVIIIEKE